MGIEGLWPAIKKNPQNIKVAPYSSFRGLRIIIDGGWLYKMRHGPRERIIYTRDIIKQPFEESEADMPWIKKVLDSLITFMSYGITPVIVMDGKASPLKDDTRQMRKDEKEPMRRELDDIMVSNSGSLITDKDALARARQLLCGLTYVPQDSTDLFKSFLSGIGLPILQCREEAERLCAALCREGVGICFSADGDCLVHGSNILIRDTSDEDTLVGTSMEKGFELVLLKDVLQSLGVTHTTFKEACVLGGCDYNPKGRIKGVAFSKALGKIRKYGSIDVLSQHEDIRSINHKACLSLFDQLPSSELIESGSIDIQPWFEERIQHICMYGLDSEVQRIQTTIEICLRHPPKKFIHSPLTPSRSLFVLLDDDEEPPTQIQYLRQAAPKKPKPNKRGKKAAITSPSLNFYTPSNTDLSNQIFAILAPPAPARPTFVILDD
jgi:5'-3' exonuclease